MNKITIIGKGKQLTLDSREVAEMVEKRHTDLLRDIRTYENYLTDAKMRSLDFFTGSTYLDAKGEVRPNYQITKKGCEFIAHKLTGQKGALFTAAYINKFHEMEQNLLAPLNQLSPQLQLLISMELKQKELEDKTQALEHRVNNLDATNIDGTPRQRLNGIIRKYAYENGILYAQAWKEFRRYFNAAYRTNIEMRRQNYMDRNGIRKISYPEYMEEVGLIEDALRVADKMLNKVS